MQIEILTAETSIFLDRKGQDLHQRDFVGVRFSENLSRTFCSTKHTVSREWFLVFFACEERFCLFWIEAGNKYWRKFRINYVSAERKLLLPRETLKTRYAIRFRYVLGKTTALPVVHVLLNFEKNQRELVNNE